ncbi:hypothetical protein MTO96_025876 [Rhipicephalus appendiculatus]
MQRASPAGRIPRADLLTMAEPLRTSLGKVSLTVLSSARGCILGILGAPSWAPIFRRQEAPLSFADGSLPTAKGDGQFTSSTPTQQVLEHIVGAFCHLRLVLAANASDRAATRCSASPPLGYGPSSLSIAVQACSPGTMQRASPAGRIPRADLLTMAEPLSRRCCVTVHLGERAAARSTGSPPSPAYSGAAEARDS